jgi:L-threonylcarbamoyladenylate synthase
VVSEKEAIEILKKGGVGVIPTDTIYGLVGSALQPPTVERIYRLRRRHPRKPMIVLIGALSDLNLFHIHLDASTRRTINRLWPGKVSIVLPCPQKKFAYLHRGSKTLAFRLPRSPKLVSFLKKTGPLVAPSANYEGRQPARNIKEAKAYFKDLVDFYLGGGQLNSLPSTVLALENGQLRLIRQGAARLRLPPLAKSKNLSKHRIET